MTTGLNYGNHEGNVYTSYLGALTEVARDQGMGIVYWPGLRTGDAYSLTTLVGDGDLEVTTRAASRRSSGAGACSRRSSSTTCPPAPPGEPLRERGKQACASTYPASRPRAGTALGLWYCNSGGNQSFDWTSRASSSPSTATCAWRPSAASSRAAG